MVFEASGHKSNQSASTRVVAVERGESVMPGCYLGHFISKKLWVV
jgi:hypothetical protein